MRKCIRCDIEMVEGLDIIEPMHGSMLAEKVKISIIACHDGNIHAIYAVTPELEKRYTAHCKKYEAQTGDPVLAKKLAMTNLYQINDDLPRKHKIFDIRLL